MKKTIGDFFPDKRVLDQLILSLKPGEGLMVKDGQLYKTKKINDKTNPPAN